MLIPIRKFVRVSDIDENGSSIIFVIRSPHIYNYILSCEGEACTGEVQMRDNTQNIWTKEADLSDNEVEKFKLDLRMMF